jgi:HD superfamily phosphodiesterase
MVDINLLSKLYAYVVTASKQFNIDESHALGHSMSVNHFANRIYESELIKNPYLKDHHTIICVSAIMHDMCDKKYMDEEYGKSLISDYLKDKISQNDLDISLKIISTMSYSTTKKNGFPQLGEYQLAYNIVREADLLDSYDFDRCIMYQMLKNNDNYQSSLDNAIKLFNNRVLKYREDNLFTTEYAQQKSFKLHNSAIKRIKKLIVQLF